MLPIGTQIRLTKNLFNMCIGDIGVVVSARHAHCREGMVYYAEGLRGHNWSVGVYEDEIEVLSRFTAEELLGV